MRLKRRNAMKKLGIALSVAAATLFGGGLLAFGQQLNSLPEGVLTQGGSTTVTLTAPPWPSAIWYPVGGGQEAAGIYAGTVNGYTNTGMICDDFSDNVQFGESWTATAYQASQLNQWNIGSDTLFGGLPNTNHGIGVSGYAEVATLVSAEFAGVGTGGDTSLTIGSKTISGIAQADLSAAIWYIAGQGGTGSPMWGQLSSTEQSLVTDLRDLYGATAIGGMEAQAYLSSLTNLWILTPTSWPEGYSRPQEMWVEVAEGGAAWMYLLMALAVCVGFIQFGRRDQATSL
jgi:hypothetical protein